MVALTPGLFDWILIGWLLNPVALKLPVKLCVDPFARVIVEPGVMVMLLNILVPFILTKPSNSTLLKARPEAPLIIPE